jgi:hypothetical protein
VAETTDRELVRYVGRAYDSARWAGFDPRPDDIMAGFAGVSIEESHPISEGFGSVVVRAVKRRSGVSEQRERSSPDHRL